MEFSKLEIQAIEGAVDQNVDGNGRVLESLELALVGGGMGDVVFN